MNVKCIQTGQLDVNCYILTEERDAAVIDPGGDCDRIIAALGGAELKMILLTHGHFDHIGAVAELAEKTGAEVYIHKADEPMLTDNKKNLSFLTGVPPKPCRATKYLDDMQKLTLGASEITVYHTPGHSEGSVCFFCDGCLFDGDLLFRGSIGRFDHGDIGKELASLKRLMDTFADDVRVCPGHGDETSIGAERRENPYITNHVN